METTPPVAPQAPEPQPIVGPKGSKIWWWVGGGAAVIVLALVGWWAFIAFAPKAVPPQVSIQKSTVIPTLTTETVTTGFDHIWEIAFLPTGEMLFTERGGTLHIMQNGMVRDLAKIADVFAQGEGGLLGMGVDAQFTQNRYIYLCFDSTKPGIKTPDVRVARFTVAADLSGLSNRTDIVTGMPVSSGRHSGCRVQMGPDGYVWIGTGDAAIGGTAIDHKNLGGKILRVDRDGKPAPGNLTGDFDPRIYSYGHRNIQGLAFFPQPQNGVLGISVEHGSYEDDEINLLKPGNFGWAPPTSEYTEQGVLMTDKKAYPDAIDAIWSSGNPTIAPSGVTFLTGEKWQAWEGRLAMAVLKNQHLRIFTVNSDNTMAKDFDDLFVKQFGRLRTAVMGPDGNLYLSTDNGKTDQIIRVIPH